MKISEERVGGHFKGSPLDASSAFFNDRLIWEEGLIDGCSFSPTESKGSYRTFLVIPITLGIGRGTALGESS